MVRVIAIFFLGAGLLACSPSFRIVADPEIIPVQNGHSELNSLDSLIGPYRQEMLQEMSSVIAYADSNFVKGRPNSPLNNWAADALLFSFRDSFPSTAPVMSLLNVGGLRSTINRGDVMLSDLFKLMPFDNEVVLVQMPMSALDSIAFYLNRSGGEPIAGVEFKNGKLLFVDGVYSDSFWVVTSDYLYNGGDKMNFFSLATGSVHTGILLRDVFIQTAERQGTLIYNDEKRIVLE
jgi:2',3'-cyclic-nucleotide 2'-phosphodiesterase (5'-nucleotidase family)